MPAFGANNSVLEAEGSLRSIDVAITSALMLGTLADHLRWAQAFCALRRDSDPSLRRSFYSR